MKNRQTPSNQERVMREGDFIVSKTDLKGRITYCNRVFIEFSGYQASELMGEQHNIVRHPDMPRGVFRFLWDTLGQRKECFAFVKNMCKDGSFYWVFANVTPDFDANGQVVGYFSVRRKASTKAIALMGGVYQAMLEEERKAGAKDACAASLAFLTHTLKQQGASYEHFVLAL